jgi:uncharacterized protein (DUF983 family)
LVGRALTDREASLLTLALLCRCPRCGSGRLFKGLLAVADRAGLIALQHRHRRLAE